VRLTEQKGKEKIERKKGNVRLKEQKGKEGIEREKGKVRLTEQKGKENNRSKFFDLDVKLVSED